MSIDLFDPSGGPIPYASDRGLKVFLKVGPEQVIEGLTNLSGYGKRLKMI
jgi:hypothetical protein